MEPPPEIIKDINQLRIPELNKRPFRVFIYRTSNLQKQAKKINVVNARLDNGMLAAAVASFRGRDRAIRLCGPNASA
jgi:hypothetical protein